MTEDSFIFHFVEHSKDKRWHTVNKEDLYQKTRVSGHTGLCWHKNISLINSATPKICRSWFAESIRKSRRTVDCDNFDEYLSNFCYIWLKPQNTSLVVTTKAIFEILISYIKSITVALFAWLVLITNSVVQLEEECTCSSTFRCLAFCRPSNRPDICRRRTKKGCLQHEAIILLRRKQDSGRLWGLEVRLGPTYSINFPVHPLADKPISIGVCASALAGYFVISPRACNWCEKYFTMNRRSVPLT